MVANRVAFGDRIFVPFGQDVDRLFGSAADWVGDGKTLSDRIWEARRQDREAIDRILRHGLATGADPLKVARDLEDYLLPAGRPVRNPDTGRIVKWRRDATGRLIRDARGRLIPANAKGVLTRTPRSGMGAYAARRLARTETSHAFNEGVRQAAEANPFAYGAKWNLSGSRKDADECDELARGSSRGFPSGVYRPDEVPRIPTHPHCFPAGTVVSGPAVIGSAQRWFDGQLIEVITTDGHFLSCTPNHPILTDQGWIAAGLLNEGDNVACGDLAERVQSLVYPNNNDRPSLIEDVAVSLGGSLLVATVTVPTSAEDFHGDGVGSEVSVIRTNGKLRRGVYTAIGEPASEELLSRRDAEPALLASDGIPAFLLKGFRAAANSGVSKRSKASQFFGRGLRNFELLRLWDAAHLNSSSSKSLVYRGPSNAERFGDGENRLATKIAANEVVSGQYVSSVAGSVSLRWVRIEQIRSKRFSGHVYNLQTVDGWYIANGIIVHNCRCFLTQVTVDDTDAVVRQLRRDAGLDGGNVIQMPQRSSLWDKTVALFWAAKAFLAKEAA